MRAIVLWFCWQMVVVVLAPNKLHAAPPQAEEADVMAPWALATAASLKERQPIAVDGVGAFGYADNPVEGTFAIFRAAPAFLRAMNGAAEGDSVARHLATEDQLEIAGLGTFTVRFRPSSEHPRRVFFTAEKGLVPPPAEPIQRSRIHLPKRSPGLRK